MGGNRPSDKNISSMRKNLRKKFDLSVKPPAAAHQSDYDSLDQEEEDGGESGEKQGLRWSTIFGKKRASTRTKDQQQQNYGTLNQEEEGEENNDNKTETVVGFSFEEEGGGGGEMSSRSSTIRPSFRQSTIFAQQRAFSVVERL